MPSIWILSVVALAVLVVLETALLLLVLQALGRIQLQVSQQAPVHAPPGTPEFLGGLRPGELAPPLVGRDIHGNEVRLEEFVGHQVVIAFVSNDCSTCLSTVETLNDVARQDRDLVVLVVGGDDAERNHEFAHKHGAIMPFLTPLPNYGRDQYHVHSFPFIFVLDKDGRIHTTAVVNGKEHLEGLLASLPQASVPQRTH